MVESEARFKMQEHQVEECEQACDGMSEAEIDEMLAESSPSSASRSWTLGIDKHCESSKKGESKLKPMKAAHAVHDEMNFQPQSDCGDPDQRLLSEADLEEAKQEGLKSTMVRAAAWIRIRC